MFWTLKRRVASSIQRRAENVFVRADFENIGGYDQIGRILNGLVKEGELIRVGYGLYARARKNRLTGRVMLAARGGFKEVAEEALNRLKVKWKPSEADLQYTRGVSTQIPSKAAVRVLSRFNRRIGTDRYEMTVL